MKKARKAAPKKATSAIPDDENSEEGSEEDSDESEEDEDAEDDEDEEDDDEGREEEQNNKTNKLVSSPTKPIATSKNIAPNNSNKNNLHAIQLKAPARSQAAKEKLNLGNPPSSPPYPLPMSLLLISLFCFLFLSSFVLSSFSPLAFVLFLFISSNNLM